jgi:LysR family transcriptional regulator, hydrogen peroxide-inducible genes activator
MELQQLRYVMAVAETGNFTKASGKMGISQPSLSQQIINLEKELGHRLFHRLGRKAVPTEAGKVFIDRSRRILFEVEDATKELSDSPSLERKIVVGAIPTLAPYVVPSLISRCRKEFPNLQVIIREDFKQILIQDVLSGDLDLALVAAPVNNSMINLEVVWQESLILAVPVGHHLASQPRVMGTDLTQETFILMGSSSSLTDRIRQFCGDHHFEPKIGSRCAQVATVKALVAIGAGISILPSGARSEDDRGSIVYVTLDDSEPMRDIAVIRHMQRYQSRGAEQFLSVLREYGKAVRT